MKIDEKLIDIVSKYLPKAITEKEFDKSFKDLGMDSMSSINLIVDLEDIYNTIIPDEYLTHENFSSLKALQKTLNSI
ncbi:acyl carrier protein [Enterococcus rotai]|uniref:Carrier domain-containing protein n=1 Tax=Enterococcus rotai TaxID=118060 RepID=A0A0U2X7M9_9ENTE|nr:phosphopantetheine-binding protein [Enterococcus rotai]ALS36072.1 hypothetical protein ATZ35_02515 [Enterococcus rotai]